MFGIQADGEVAAAIVFLAEFKIESLLDNNTVGVFYVPISGRRNTNNRLEPTHGIANAIERR